MIHKFNDLLYLEANQDINEEVKKGNIEHGQAHLEIAGLKEIQEGKRKFHKDFIPYNEALYLETFPGVREAVENEEFTSAFDHFCQFGYAEILTGKRPWKKIIDQNDVSDAEKIDINREDEIAQPKNIMNFDEESYLEVNNDIKEAISNGIFKDALDHMEKVGHPEIESGSRKFHKDFEPYNEALYLETFPDVRESMANEEFTSAFDHFCQFGYEEILTGKRAWNTSKTEVVKIKKVIAVLGIPRSGLTLLTAMLGSHSQITAWFLPYATRKDLGVNPFTDPNSIQTQYKEAFPSTDTLKETMVISESTSSFENIQFIMESLKNLSENGVETKVIWIVRDVNHCYLSQNEASQKHWGDTSEPLTRDSYVNYIKFAKKGYKQLIQSLFHQEHTIVSYQNIIQTETSIQKVMNYLDLASENNQINVNCFRNLNVAGDPDFLEYPNINHNREIDRSNLWNDQKKLQTSLNGRMSLFTQEFNALVHGIKADKTYNLSEYQKDLLQKLFDKDYYLDTYMDIAKAEVDPLTHYIDFGWEENRKPNNTFDTKLYRENVHDGSEFNPFVHFCFIGRYEIDLGELLPKGGMTDLLLIDPEKYIITDDLLLEAPLFKNPEVSIIIPAYNQEKYTLACIESIIKHTEDVKYEIIVMDDKSPDKSARKLGKYMKNIIFHSNKENLGFLLNCNKGVTFSKGKYLLFLNNDTNVQPGWLSSLVELIDPSKKIGMVGSRLVYPNGQQQEAGGIIWNDANGWNFGRLDDPYKPEYNYVKETDYLTGAAMMIWKPLWDVIGGFDERYVPAYYEDSDLSFEVRKHGYKVLFQPKSVVIHFEGISNGTDLGSGIKQYQVTNKQHFFDKWKDILETEHFHDAQDIFLARDRSKNKKHILVIDHYVPHFDKDAGSRTMWQYLLLFKDLGYHVTFIGDNFYKHEPYTSMLEQYGIEVLYGSHYVHNFDAWLLENGRYFDVAYLLRPHIAIKYIEKIRKYTNATIFYNGTDFHFLRMQREYDITQDPKLLIEVEKTKEQEINLFSQSDCILTISEYERDYFNTEFPEWNIDLIPTFIYREKLPLSNNDYKDREGIMFVGGFAHKPNVEGVKWFLSEIWPLIVKKIPHLKFYIVGSSMPDEIKKLSNGNIIAKGFLTDEELATLYNNVRAVVAPLTFGAGVKGKIIEAICNGVPTITTDIGAEGIVDSKNILLVDNNVTGFAKKVVNIYNDQGEWKKLRKKQIDYGRQYFSLKNVKTHIDKVFSKDYK